MSDSERKKLVVRAAIVALGTLFSRLLGLVRDMTLAACFSRGATDAFFVAFTIPNALRQILGEGAVSSAVVPVLTKRLEEGGEDAARTFFAKARGVSLVALTVVTILGVVFAEPLTSLFAGGYRERPEQFARTVTLTRTVFPYIFFMGSAALGMAALHTKRKFAVAAFAPALLNVAFVVGAFVLPPVLAARGIDTAEALPICALVGGALQVLAQIPALRQIGYAGLPRVDFTDPAVRDMLRRLVPMTFGIGVYYIDLVLSRRFLSSMGEGAQSYFSWAARLCDFPQGIFVLALTSAALPSLATFAARRDFDELGKTFAYGMRLSFFVAIPASVASIALAEPLVRTLFERGAFDALSTRETARALVLQGAAIWTVAAVRQLVPVFHALADTRTPVVVSAIDLVAFIVLALVLRGPMGHVGVSAAVFGSSLVQMGLLWYALTKKLPDPRTREILASAGRTLGASLVAGVAGWGAARIVPGRTLPGILGALAFVLVFVLAGYGLKMTELDAIGGGLSRKLRRQRA